jgi:hypothetical protein
MPATIKRYIDYDFTDIENALFEIKQSPNSANLNELNREINAFFKDSKCKQVLYTRNTDKMFFGMSVMPVIKADKVYDIIQEDEPVRITEYYLELDSKLFSPTLGLSTREITAVLLHEIGHMVNDTSPVDKLRKELDMYLVKNNETIKTSDSVHYQEILAFGIKDALRKITSLFETDDDEIIADSFVVACGYGPELESAFEKVVKNSYRINKDVSNKFIVLAWVIRLYTDIKLRRIVAIKSLQKGESYTASKLEKREMENVVRRLRRIDDDTLIEAVGFDLVADKVNSTMSRIKYKGIRSFEDDLYDYNLQVKNVQHEDEALELLHKINTRLNIIDDYVTSENISENERKRWYALINKYNKLREVLSNKSVYRNNYRRLQIIGAPEYYV